MSSSAVSAKRGLVFGQLVLLSLLSVGSGFLGLSAFPHTVVLFTLALAMAALVVAQYMGLKMEGALIYWIFFVPVILFVVLLVPLLPDIAHVALPLVGAR